MADTLYVEIVSPTGSVFRGDAVGVKAPGVEGSFEVLRDHAPLIAAFDLGRLTVRLADTTRLDFATSGGFIEVLNNTVTVLAETAELSDKIDTERARQAEAEALARIAEASDPEERRRAEARLERARNRLRTAIASV